jgi:hypothetical protein
MFAPPLCVLNTLEGAELCNKLNIAHFNCRAWWEEEGSAPLCTVLSASLDF